MTSIPSSHQDLLADQTKAFALVATVMEDGTPQVTVVWFTWDGRYISINTAKGRVKERNLRARPSVAIAIPDPGNPYRYLQIRGRVAEIVEGGEAVAHISQLSHKYTGKDFEVGQETRVMFRIAVEDTSTYG